MKWIIVLVLAGYVYKMDFALHIVFNMTFSDYFSKTI